MARIAYSNFCETFSTTHRLLPSSLGSARTSVNEPSVGDDVRRNSPVPGMHTIPVSADNHSGNSSLRDPTVEGSGDGTDGPILVVDDEPDVLLLCRVNLQHAGYDVMEASDGEQGLALALSEVPDAIVLDLMLPLMDGYARSISCRPPSGPGPSRSWCSRRRRSAKIAFGAGNRERPST